MVVKMLKAIKSLLSRKTKLSPKVVVEEVDHSTRRLQIMDGPEPLAYLSGKIKPKPGEVWLCRDPRYVLFIEEANKPVASIFDTKLSVWVEKSSEFMECWRWASPEHQFDPVFREDNSNLVLRLKRYTR